MSIGTNIKRLREARNLTQENLAEMLGVTFQAVSSWERDEYLPETANLIKLADAMDVSVSSIAEDKPDTFKMKDAIYNWEHMKTYVKTVAKSEKMENTLKALDFAVEVHKEQTRKKTDVPYIYHPLNMACHALAMGIREDEIIATILLHDVIEDCKKKDKSKYTVEDIPVSDEAGDLIRLMTCEKTTDENREEILDAYYGALGQNPKAALIKLLDRCNNLTTMSWGLSRKRIYRTIKETEYYYPTLLKAVKNTAEYNDSAWLLQYQIESMLDIYKRLM